MSQPSRRKLLLCLGSAAGFALIARDGRAEQRPLAIDGYDPVAYFTVGKPVRGVPEFEYEWDERLYRFSSATHRDLFKADPVRYAPQFSGFCAVSLARGEVAGVNPEYWLVSDGKLYLFGKPVGPQLFQQDIAENLRKAESHRTLVQRQ